MAGSPTDRQENTRFLINPRVRRLTIRMRKRRLLGSIRGVRPLSIGQRYQSAIGIGEGEGRWIPWLRCMLFIIICFFLSEGTAGAGGIWREWTGKNSRFWRDPENWSPKGIPQDGDFLDFSGPNDPDHKMMVNDIDDLNVSFLNFYKSDFVLNGKPVTLYELDGDLGVPVINCPLIFKDGGVIYDEWSDIVINGPITIPEGKVLHLDAGALGFDSDSGSTYPGAIHVNEIQGGGFVSASCRDDESLISFLSGCPNFTGTMLIATAPGSHVAFASPEPVLDEAHLLIHKGFEARIRLDFPNQFTSNSLVEISDGSKLILEKNNVSIGVLKMSNSANDSVPSTIETGSNLLGISRGIDARVGGGSFRQVIRGRLKMNGQHNVLVDGEGKAELEIAANIEGDGFEKFGNGTLLLSGNNAIAGNILISGGTLQPLKASGLGLAGAASSVHLTGGILVLENLKIDGVPLFVDAPLSSNTGLVAYDDCVWEGPVILNSSLNIIPVNTLSPDGFCDFQGIISGPGGLQISTAVFGSGTVRLSGPQANTFTGPTVVNAFRLELGKPDSVRALNGPLIVGGPFGASKCEARWLNRYQGIGTALTIHSNGFVNLHGFNEDFSTVEFNGGEVATGVGQFAFYQTLTVNPSKNPAIINGFLGLPPGTSVMNINDGPAEPDLLIHAVVFGTAEQLIKQGAGSVRFGGANTYSGVTQVNEGVLEVSNDSALGGTNAGTLVRKGASLLFSASVHVPENIEFEGDASVGGRITVSDDDLHAALSGTLTYNGSLAVDVGGTQRNVDLSSLSIDGPILGNGTLIKLGNGPLSLGGDQPNAYAGDTLVARGSLLLVKPTGVTTIPKRLVIGTGGLNAQAVVDQWSSFNIVGSVTVDRGGLWQLHGNAEGFSVPDLQGDAPLTLKNGGSVSTGDLGKGAIYLPVGGDVVVLPGGTGHSSIQGTLGLDPGPHHFVVGSHTFGAGGPECTIDAVITQTSTAADLIKEGSGTLVLTATNLYKGTTTLSGGVLQVEGAQVFSTLKLITGVLQGSGMVGPLILSGGAGVVAPRISAGILICDNVAAESGGGVLQLSLNGPKPGSGYDQLVVRGVCNLNGVSLKANMHYTPSSSDQFTIIQTGGVDDPVVGQFDGLAEGAVLSISGIPFRITYQGGDGTDVVLSRVAQFAPGTSVWIHPADGDWNDPLNWSPSGVPNGGSAGITNILGFALHIASATDVHLSQFTYDNPLCTISGNGNFTIGDLFLWRGGSFSGSGTLVAAGGMVLSSPETAVSKSLQGKTLVNMQNASWSEDGIVVFSGGAVLSNRVGAVFSCEGNGSIQSGLGGGRIDNSGSFIKSAGDGQTLIQVPFYNSGTIQVESGTLSLSGGGTNEGIIVTSPGALLTLGGGTHEFTSQSSLSGLGDFSTGALLSSAHLNGSVQLTGSNLFTAGVVDFTGSYSLSNSDVVIRGGSASFNGSGSVDANSLVLGPFGTLGGSNRVTVEGPIVWNASSTMQGSNDVVALGGVAIHDDGQVLKERRLINASSSVWTNSGQGVFSLVNGANWSNAPGSSLEIVGGGSIQGGGKSVLQNRGTLLKDGRTNELRLQVPLYSEGIVDVQSGVLILNGDQDASGGEFRVASGTALQFANGSHRLLSESTLLGDGDLLVSAGEVFMDGLVKVTGRHVFSGGTAWITGGYELAGNTLTITSGKVDLSGSGFMQPSALTIGAFGTLSGSQPITVTGPMSLGPLASLTGSNPVLASGGMVINGDVTLSGRTLINTANGIWTNLGNAQLTFLNGAVLSNAPGAVMQFIGNGHWAAGVGGGMLANAGTLRKVGGSSTFPNTVPLWNVGTVEIQDSKMAFDGGAQFIQQAGVTRLIGGTLVSTAPIQILGGDLIGKGRVSGSVMNAGRIRPGGLGNLPTASNVANGHSAPPAEVGTEDIVIEGDFTQTSDGVLDLEFGGAEVRRLVVSNAVHLAGTLNIQLTNGFYPSANSSFSIVSGSQVSGSFDTINIPSEAFQMALSATNGNIVLHVTNVRPVIEAIPEQHVEIGGTLTLDVHASDEDVPKQVLRFSLVNPPMGAVIDASSGRLSWTPSASQLGLFVISVNVTDNGPQPLSVSTSFRVVVGDAGQQTESVTSILWGPTASDGARLRFIGGPNRSYVTEYSPQILGPWLDLSTNLSDALGIWTLTDLSATNQSRYYRFRSQNP